MNDIDNDWGPLSWLSPIEHGLFVMIGLLMYVLITRISHQHRHPSAAIAWVVVIIAFPYLGMPLFLLFGTRKFPRPKRLGRRREVRRTVPGAPAWAVDLLAAMDVAGPTPNTSIVFHEDGRDARDTLLAMIDGASARIDACTFILGNDEIGRSLIDALSRAARRGVTVRLLLDAIGSLKAPRVPLRDLRTAGAQVRWFMPLLHNPLRGRINLRNHRKLVIIDGSTMWGGGRNLADEYFIDPTGKPGWIDLSVVTTGALAARGTTLFERDWQAASGRISGADTVVGPALEPGPGALAQLVPSGPDHSDDTVYSLMLAAAYRAERRLLAVTPYFVPDDALLSAWCIAARRGVQVTLVLPRRSNHLTADWARERGLRMLAEAGASIRLHAGMIHGKVMVVDEALALCGSVNIDGRSLFLNYELTTAFYGAAEIGWLARWTEQLAERSAAYRPSRPPWWRDVFEGIVRAVAFQL